MKPCNLYLLLTIDHSNQPTYKGDSSHFETRLMREIQNICTKKRFDEKAKELEDYVYQMLDFQLNFNLYGNVKDLIKNGKVSFKTFGRRGSKLMLFTVNDEGMLNDAYLGKHYEVTIYYINSDSSVIETIND